MLYAHASTDIPEGKWQTLEEHLRNVARMAGAFASSFHGEEWASLLGLVHDAGKASDAFQQRLHGRPIKVDHSTAGAKLLSERYSPDGLALGTNLAYLCAGHHGGLPNWSRPGLRSSLHERLGKEVEPFDGFYDLVDLPDMDEFLASLPPLLKKSTQEQVAYSFSFLMRMLYSCLVDADFIDTEACLSPKQAKFRGKGGKSLVQMRDDLKNYFASLDSRADEDGNPELNEARNAIRAACIQAADSAPGLFTLGVPTGAGKTLSSLAFALEHALRNGQERVIYVIPFTSIVEQTAAVFKDIFRAENVVEHHSNYAFSDSEDDDERVLRERLAMENWDAPLVVTTNVQFFESLYSSKPSRCRKVHNIANSVVVLDEVQSLPDDLMEPCLAALEELADSYGTTAVLCSATQPALESIWPFETDVTDIAPDGVYDKSVFEERVSYSDLGTVEFDDLVSRLAEQEQAMCIVSTRKAAADLYDALVANRGDEVYHLSAMMVPVHRSAVLAEVRERLEDERPCILISTQLVEAGVDIDFPVVFRQLAGIDSIKQAAGRCNREGKSPNGHGSVFVFDCPDFRLKPAAGWLFNMCQLGNEILREYGIPGAFGEQGVTAFFHRRYSEADTDRGDVFKELSSPGNMNKANYQYEAYDKSFKLIDDDTRSIVVPWDDRGLELIEALETGDFDFRVGRKLQAYAVSVRQFAYRKLDEQGALIDIGPYTVLEPIEGNLRFYSEEKGLVTEGGDLPIL